MKLKRIERNQIKFTSSLVILFVMFTFCVMAFVRLAREAVSYTHLDVYKRQMPTCCVARVVCVDSNA